MLLEMSSSGGPRQPHPDNVKWTGVMIFGGIVAALGPTASELGKPAKGQFNFWLYPPTFVGYLGLLLALIGLWGLIRGREFTFASKRPKKIAQPTRVHRTPGHMGFVTVGNSLVLDPESETPRVKEMSHGPLGGGWQSGELPIHVTSLGPSGERDMISEAPHESWIWTYENVTFVNESDDYLTFHLWLVVATADKVGIRELAADPNVPIALTPHETRHEARIGFRLKLWDFTGDEGLHPGRPKELQLIEDGSKGRCAVVSYEPRTPKSDSRARWDATMDVARARSDNYATLANEMLATPASHARARDINRPPNFDDERRDYRDIMTNCDGNGQVWEPVIHALIDRTRAKIEAWNPRHVERFDEPNVTDVSLSLMDAMLHSDEIPALRDLRRRFERLDRILGL